MVSGTGGERAFLGAAPIEAAQPYPFTWDAVTYDRPHRYSNPMIRGRATLTVRVIW